jgi:hypothetical protein
MKITHYTSVVAIPYPIEDLWNEILIYSRGNIFSDHKSARIVINNEIVQGRDPRSVRVSVMNQDSFFVVGSCGD